MRWNLLPLQATKWTPRYAQRLGPCLPWAVLCQAKQGQFSAWSTVCVPHCFMSHRPCSCASTASDGCRGTAAKRSWRGRWHDFSSSGKDGLHYTENKVLGFSTKCFLSADDRHSYGEAVRRDGRWIESHNSYLRPRDGIPAPAMSLWHAYAQHSITRTSPSCSRLHPRPCFTAGPLWLVGRRIYSKAVHHNLWGIYRKNKQRDYLAWFKWWLLLKCPVLSLNTMILQLEANCSAGGHGNVSPATFHWEVWTERVIALQGLPCVCTLQYFISVSATDTAGMKASFMKSACVHLLPAVTSTACGSPSQRRSWSGCSATHLPTTESSCQTRAKMPHWISHKTTTLLTQQLFNWDVVHHF